MTFFSLSINVVLYFGMMIDAMMYARIPDPPIKEKITHASLTSVGSMLKYSVSEWAQEKSVTEVILEAPGQEPVIRLHPLKPLREVCVIRGTLEEILEANKDRVSEDYVSIVLTDEQELYQPKEQLERIFTHILEVRTERNWKLAKEWEDGQEEETQTDPKLVFEQFFSQIQGDTKNQ